ncbi:MULTISPECIES: hypothetical protein [unclassified Mesorhizobium]|uniref:hypothetical protein n=1 Tax=unclassified Mesorhizobium TaxID=325217 RepID=UPI00041C0562|nr:MULTISPECIES: hypothetical protein [unclassified Mesorhizobium]
MHHARRVAGRIRCRSGEKLLFSIIPLFAMSMQLGSRKQRLVEMRAGRIARITNEATMLQTMPCLSWTLARSDLEADPAWLDIPQLSAGDGV